MFYADTNLLNKTISVMDNLDINYKVGKIASGDQFVTKSESVKEVNALYDDIYAIEMEAAAIAHTCTLYKVPFIIYRSISDVIDSEQQHLDYFEFLAEASENATLVLKELIKVI